MFTNKDNFAIYLKIQEVRQIYSNFKSTVLLQLEKLENQIETIIYELSQRDELDSICQNIIENDNSTLNDDEVQEIAQIWNKISYQKNDEYFPKFSDQLVSRIQKTLKLWEQQIQETLQMDLRIIPIYSKSLYKFDLNTKFPSIQVNDEIMIEQTQSQTHYCFAVVDQRLNQIETSSIKFKFPKFIGDIGVGICDLAVLKSKNFRPQLNQVNNGAFVCFQDSYTINTEQDEYNWKTKGFKYGERDVIDKENIYLNHIQVVYEPTLKRATWIKVQKPEDGYSVVLLNDKRELYFCCTVLCTKILSQKIYKDNNNKIIPIQNISIWKLFMLRLYCQNIRSQSRNSCGLKSFLFVTIIYISIISFFIIFILENTKQNYQFKYVLIFFLDYLHQKTNISAKQNSLTQFLFLIFLMFQSKINFYLELIIMRSKSPLVSPQNYNKIQQYIILYHITTNLLTPTQKHHVSQLSTGQNNSNSPQTDFRLKKREFQLSTPNQGLDKQKLISTANNYYHPNSIQRIQTSESPAKILFKTGYEQQQEIKRLTQENLNLKDLVKKQEDQLKQLFELENILEQNKQLQEKIEKLEKENSILRQAEEQANKNKDDQ